MEKQSTTTYGALFRRLRENHGYARQSDLAQALDYDQSLISKIESEKTRPSVKLLVRLGNLLPLTETERDELANAIAEVRRTAAEEAHVKDSERVRSALRPSPTPTGELPPIDPMGSIPELAVALAQNEELRDLVLKLSRVYQDERKRKALQSMLDMMENT